MKVKEKSEKSWLKTQCPKNEDHGIWSHHFMQIDVETTETVTDFMYLGSKMTAAMKSKDTCSLEGKL